MTAFDDILAEEWTVSPASGLICIGNHPLGEFEEDFDPGYTEKDRHRAAIAVLGKRALAWMLAHPMTCTMPAAYHERQAILAEARKLGWEPEGRQVVMSVATDRGPFRAAFERCGKRAYEAYEKAMGWVTCAWSQLPPDHRNAWIEAAAAAIGEDEMRKEQERKP